MTRRWASDHDDLTEFRQILDTGCACSLTVIRLMLDTAHLSQKKRWAVQVELSLMERR